MIRLFDIKNLTKSPAIFDENKLKWVNAQHIKMLDNSELLKVIDVVFCEKINIDLALSVVKEKAKDLLSIKESLKFCQTESIKIGDEFKDEISNESTKKLISEFYKRVADIDTSNIDEIKDCMQSFLLEKDLKMKEVALPLRIILTGSKNSPGIFEIISILGREIFIKRVEDYIQS
jgi:glutamyl-tRNA synthetase